MGTQLGKTLLFTDNDDWNDEEIVLGYRAQNHIESAFRDMKNPHFLGWSPMFHWTDSKIRVHAFYCMLGISLLHYVHLHARRVCPQITIDQLKTELADIYDFVLLYPPRGEKGPPRTATVHSKQTLTQVLLAQALGLDALHTQTRG